MSYLGYLSINSLLDYTFMIRKNLLFCKIIRIKTSSKSLFLTFMASFHVESEVCPVCHSTGNSKVHATYSRAIIDIIHGKPVYQDLSITRIFCDSCGHSHAILPDTIIPYSQYSLFFILRVLAEYFARRKTVSFLCATYNITPSMLYRWRDLFLQNRSLWLGILEQREQPPYYFLCSLVRLERFSEFCSGYFRLTGSSFLQRHANPTARFGRRQI